MARELTVNLHDVRSAGSRRAARRSARSSPTTARARSATSTPRPPGRWSRWSWWPGGAAHRVHQNSCCCSISSRFTVTGICARPATSSLLRADPGGGEPARVERGLLGQPAAVRRTPRSARSAAFVRIGERAVDEFPDAHARLAELGEGGQGVVDQPGDVARVHLPSPDHPHGHPELPDPRLEHASTPLCESFVLVQSLRRTAG